MFSTVTAAAAKNRRRVPSPGGAVLRSARAGVGTLAAATLAAMSCSYEITTNASVAPELMATSADTVSIGAPLEFYGRSFLLDVRGYTTLRFEGEFRSQNGASNPVDFSIRPHRTSNGVLLWANVGPFSNPFVCNDKDPYDDVWTCYDLPGDALLGTFNGTVTASNHFREGGQVVGEPIPMELTFGPSIVIRKLRPLESDCPEPAKRLIGGFPYELEVEAIGFEASSFTLYTENEPEVDARARVHRAAPIDGRATLGWDAPLVFAPVNDGVVFYGANVLIDARGTKNEKIGVAYTFGVHRPIEYIDKGTPLVAEIEAPQPASTRGCIAGGVNGVNVTYTEMTSETRQRGFQTRYDETWTEDHSSNYSTSHEKRRGINSQFTIGAENNWSFTWNEARNASWNAHGSVTLGFQGGIGPVGVNGSVTGGLARDWGWQRSVGGSLGGSTNISRTVGNDFSESDSESWATTDSNGYNETIGTSATEDVSSTDAITETISADVIAGLQGVWYRQAIRLMRPGLVYAYNMCGDYHVVAETEHSDYRWNFALAQDTTCSPLPEPALPKKQCILGCKN